MLSVTVLYEDDTVLVINKPAGLVVHSDGRTEEPTVMDWLLAKYPKILGVGDASVTALNVKRYPPVGGLNASDRSGIVHRLDRATSGVLLIAKTQKAFWHFKKQFQKNLVRKIYHAFVYGRVKYDEGVIDRPIARSRRNPVLWSATRGRKDREREAVTEYRVLKRFTAPPATGGAVNESENFSFLELRPRTGRTHQIRVHLKAINYPIVCDKLYASKRLLARGVEASLGCPLGFTRLALHAFSLKFKLPSGKELTVEAPYPRDFKRALDKFT